MNILRLNLLSRLRAWKQHVETNLAEQRKAILLLEVANSSLAARLEKLERDNELLWAVLKSLSILAIKTLHNLDNAFSSEMRYCFVRHGSRIRILAIEKGVHGLDELRSELGGEIIDGVTDGSIQTIEISQMRTDGSHTSWRSIPWLVEILKAHPDEFRAVLMAIEHPIGQKFRIPDQVMKARTRDLDLLDFLS